MLGIGAIIGAGIFATIGTAAAGDATRPGAGPALILSFVVTAVACGFAALCYAEFAAMVPISGSAYTYAYATLGELVAWIIGWDLIIEYAVGNVAVAISWGNYFKTLRLGLRHHHPRLAVDRLPDGRAHSRACSRARRISSACPIVFNILAFGIVALITIVLVIGIRESASLNTGMVRAEARSCSAFFVIVGWSYTHAGQLARRSRRTAGRACRPGAAIVFFAYIGFDAVSTVAEEVADPKRDLPIGIIGSLIICTIIYIVVAVVFTGIIPYGVLRQEARDRTGRAADDGAAVREHRAAGATCSSASWRSDRSSRTRPCCWCFSSASRGSSSRWRATGCCRRASPKCIRGSARRTSRRS